MKFRIKFVEGIGYFSQVQNNSFWYKINKEELGFRLYDGDSHNYPMQTREEAAQRIDDYKRRLMAENNEPQYFDY